MRTEVLAVDSERPEGAALARAAAVICDGGLVAFPTETVYGLGADATSAAAVARIFEAKQRPASDPLIVHVAAPDEVAHVAFDPPPLAARLAEGFWPGPLTLVLPRAEVIPASVSAGRATVAVRMPDHPVALALIRAAGRPIAAPSANLFSRPSPTTARHVLEDLDGRIDLVLDGGPTPVGVESTVVDLTVDPPAVLRPGGVSLEALRAVVPGIELRLRRLEVDSTEAAAPGMLLKHYSPRAELLLFAGADAAAHLVTEAERLVGEGRRVGVLTYDGEAAPAGATAEDLGPTEAPEQTARRLFAALRALDGRGVDVILARAPDRRGLGLAVWDRLVRAAEGRVLESPL